MHATTVTCRPAIAHDRPQLLDIYQQARLHELSHIGWSDAQKLQFLTMQFDTQDRYYRQQYAHAQFLLIEQNGNVIGRLYRTAHDNEIHIIDISLLPPWRGMGIGTSILQAVIEEAAESDRHVSLQVEKNNTAFHLYRRLGFEVVDDNGVYWRMHCHSRSKQTI